MRKLWGGLNDLMGKMGNWALDGTMEHLGALWWCNGQNRNPSNGKIGGSRPQIIFKGLNGSTALFQTYGPQKCCSFFSFLPFPFFSSFSFFFFFLSVSLRTPLAPGPLDIVHPCHPVATPLALLKDRFLKKMLLKRAKNLSLFFFFFELYFCKAQIILLLWLKTISGF